jgi:drug/metabolite transporter (DMT)-like permease
MGLESGVLFAFAAMLTWGVGDFLIQRSIRKVGNLETLAFIGIIGSILLLPFASKEFYLLSESSNILLLGFLGLLTFFAAILNFEALKEGKLSVIEVILEIELPVAIALGIIFLHESISLIQLIIIGLIFLSIILIATKSFSHFKSKLEKGVLVAAGAAVLTGGVDFFVGMSSKTISPILAIWASWLFFTIITVILILKKHGVKRLVNHAKENKSLLLATGIFDTMAWVFYAKAVFNNEIALITSITESYPAVAILLGVVFNKERIKTHQIIGALLALSGSIWLASTL